MAVMPLVSRPGRFTVTLAAISVATIVVMTALLLWQLRVKDLRHAAGETVALSRIVAEQMTRSLQSVDLALDAVLNRLAQAEQLKLSFDDFAIHAMLQSRVETMPQLRSMFIVDVNGNIASSALSHPAPKIAVNDRDYFTSVRDRPDLDLYISSPATNRLDGQWTVFASRRIRNSRGEFVGVLVGSLNIAYLESLYDSIKLDSVGPIGLYLNDGSQVAPAPHKGSPMASKASLPRLEGDGKAEPPRRTVRTEGPDAGTTTYRAVGGFPLVLAVGNHDHDALHAWRDTARLIVTAAAAIIVLLLGATALLLRWQRREEETATTARERGNRLSAMVDSAMDAIVTVDHEQRVAAFNPAAESMFGYREEQIRGKPLDLLIPERYRAAHERHVLGFLDGGIAERSKDPRRGIVGLRADGTEFPLESTIAQVTVDGKQMLTAILRDVSERRRAESDLRESHRQLRELASSLQAVREEERTSIARELHDELGQQLLRLRMDLSWLATRLRDRSPAVQEKVAEMKHFVAGTVDVLRRVTTRLRPPLLDDLGLADAAQWQLDDFSRRTGIAVESYITADNGALDERISINLFRILQESLTNVARHANATLVQVFLSTDDEGLQMEVRDNGKGAQAGDGRQLGHGLLGIRERTILLGGRMTIVTEPGQGFSVSIRIPLTASQSAGERK